MDSGRDSITLPQRADRQRRKSTRQRLWSKSRKHALSARRRYWPAPCGPLILTSIRGRWAQLQQSSSGELRPLDRLAEGEELGSNLLHVGQRTPANSGGRGARQRRAKAALFRHGPAPRPRYVRTALNIRHSPQTLVGPFRADSVAKVFLSSPFKTRRAPEVTSSRFSGDISLALRIVSP